MLSRRAFFARLLGHPEARAFLLNSLAVGEADSARDLDRVAALVPDPTLARRVYRHYAEELLAGLAAGSSRRARGVPIAVLRAIHADERRHVAYATAALCELAARRGRGPVVRALRAARRAEARAHRVVSRAFMARLLALLGAPRRVRAAARVSIDLGCARRWLFPGGLDAPEIADPMPIPPRARPRAARVAP